MKELFVFRNDLRLEDNLGLAEHVSGSRLLCVYVEEPAQPWFQVKGMGGQRKRFHLESLHSLQASLRALQG